MREIDLTGKIALVTGAGQGIGYAVAVELARCGAGVAVLDLKLDEKHPVCAAVRALGVDCLPISGNVADEASVAEAFAAVGRKFGRLDILVNNAGITRDAMSKKMTADQFRQVLDVNLLGSFLCAQKAMELMGKAGGSIINFSSIAAFLGNVGQANYSASKGGIVGMTRTLALEGARNNVRVNAISPGFIATPMTETIPADIKEAAIAKIPLHRIGQPEDVANAVLFLASELSSFITGHCIHVNGGRYMD
ncbi:3-oxoacyl-[acyl-carrier-protein] reductase FabG [bioreactor metagenome]|uniref:3-oxoacyl-[acyl-carrier-protein] reductase FabG n=1 Tax=bioreactor metagenome TaxID=1076179 RepID=A0A645AKW1_9ZZZZ